MFLLNKATLIGKLEATPYTKENLSNADANFNVRISDLSYSHEVAEYKRKVLNGSLDAHTSVMGARTGTVSFKIDLSTSATEPEWGKMLQACGYKGIGWTDGLPVALASATDGLSYFPSSECTHIPMTFYIQETAEGASPNGSWIEFAGAMGEATILVGTVGEPIQIMFEMTGRFALIEDYLFANTINPTSLSTTQPPPLLSCTATVNSVAQDFDSFEIKTGNDVQIWGNPADSSGVKGAYIAGRETTLTLNPTAKRLAEESFYADWIGSTVRAVSIGLSSSPPVTLLAPTAQLITVSAGERNGARVHEKTYLLTGAVGTPDSSFEILIGTKGA